MTIRERLRWSESSNEWSRALTQAFIASLGIWMLAFIAGIWSGAAIRPVPALYRSHPQSIGNPETAHILSTNIGVLLLSACGLFTFGFTSIVTLLVSGLFAGVVIGACYHNGMSLSVILWLTLPHSIELAGLWLGSSIGLIGYRLGCGLFNQHRRHEPVLRIDCALLFKVLLISLAITIIAACIEGEITVKRIAGQYV